jgi:Family of unknown function (DUF6092)
MKAGSLQFDLLAFLSYLAVSARGCLDEPKEYGPFRLVDGMARLIEICQEAGLADEGWTELRAFVDAHKLSVMDEAADYATFLDDVVARTVGLLEQA